MFICIRKFQLQLALLALFLLLLTVLELGRAGEESSTQTAYSCRLPEQTFVIDPGHGGEDGGAVSAGGVQEDTVNLAIGRRLDLLLGFYGVKTRMTRTEDISLHDDTAENLRQKKTSDLKNRVALINATADATLISIHQNAFPQRQYRGAQVFYREDEASRLLALELQGLVQSCLDPSNKRQAQRVSKSVYLMNHVACRAVLVECGFLSNAVDEARLQEKDYQQKIAAVIATACLKG